MPQRIVHPLRLRCAAIELVAQAMLPTVEKARLRPVSVRVNQPTPIGTWHIAPQRGPRIPAPIAPLTQASESRHRICRVCREAAAQSHRFLRLLRRIWSISMASRAGTRNASGGGAFFERLVEGEFADTEQAGSRLDREPLAHRGKNLRLGFLGDAARVGLGSERLVTGAASATGGSASVEPESCDGWGLLAKGTNNDFGCHEKSIFLR